MEDTTNVNVPTMGFKTGKLFKMVKRASMIAGFIILLMTLGGSGENQVWGMVIGYSFLLAATILFVSNVTSKIIRSTNSKAKSLISIMTTIGPFIVFLILLTCIIILIGSFFKQIAADSVTPSFHTLNTLSILVSLMITYLFNKNTSTEEFIKTQEVNKISGMVMYLLELLGFIIVISMFIILKFYVTDGYRNIR